MKKKTKTLAYLMTWERFRPGNEISHRPSIQQLCDTIRDAHRFNRAMRWRRLNELIEILQNPPLWWAGDKEELRQELKAIKKRLSRDNKKRTVKTFTNKILD